MFYIYIVKYKKGQAMKKILKQMICDFIDFFDRMIDEEFKRVDEFCHQH